LNAQICDALLIARRQTRTRRQCADPLRQPLRAHVGSGAFRRWHVCARLDLRDRADHGRARFIGRRLRRLHLAIERRDLLIDLQQFAARASAFGLKLLDLPIRSIQLRERDEAVGRRRDLRHAELEIARAEHQRAQADTATIATASTTPTENL
jgi:hypothetical protein